MISDQRHRRVSRRRLLSMTSLFTALAAGGALLQACGQGGSTSTPAKPATTSAPAKPTAAPQAAPAKKAGAKEVNLWHPWGVKQAEPIVTLTDEFNTQQTDVHVVLTFVPGEQLTQKVLASLSAGNPPETMPASPFNLPAFADANGIKDLREYATSGETDPKDIYPGPLNVITYKGKTVAVPLTVGTQGYFMNEDLFKAAGLDAAKPPKTWDDLVRYAKEMTRPSEKQWGWMLHNDGTGGTSQQWVSYLRQNGGDVLDANHTKAAFNGPEGVEALQFWVDLVNTHKVSPKAKVTGADVTQAYGTGKVGFFQEYPFYLGQIREYKFRSQTAPLTQKVKPGNVLGGWYFPIFTRSKEPASGWTVLNWLFRPENQYRLNIGMGNLPTKASTTNYPRYQEHLKQEPQIKAFVDQLPVAQPWPAVRVMPEVTKLLGEAIQEAVYQQATPQQALDGAAQKTDALLKQAQRGA